MIDVRWRELASVLVGYSTAVRAGERVLVTMMEEHTLPLARAVYAQAVRAGGLPQIEFQSAALERDLLLYGTDEQVGHVSEWQTTGMEWADVYIGLRGASNPHVLDDIATDRIARRKRAMGVISKMRTEKTRWVLIRVPDESFAQQAGITLDTVMDFFFRAVLRDWRDESRQYAAVRTLFDGGSKVTIEGIGTNLTFSTKGRKYVIEDGHINMPGGELFTAPVEDSVEGEISFTYPGVYAGRSIEGIHLKFSSGRVCDAGASSNESLLHDLLDMDEGSRGVGEFGVGLNAGVDRFFGDMLYDEKIRGTVHIALGRSYKECGGRNDSALHWDIVKDLRLEGRVTVDGKVVLERGRFAPV